MSSPYRVEWLQPRHARRIAQIERGSHGTGERRGRATIAGMLDAADRDGTSLCVGAFAGSRLVGYVLAFTQPPVLAAPRGSAHEATRELEADGIHVADFAVARRHADAAALLTERLGGLVRDRQSVALEPRTPQDPPRSLATALRAQVVRGGQTIGLLDSVAGWELLAPWWNALVGNTASVTVFQSYDYVRAWWRHFGLSGQPWIVVVIENDQPVAIAPLQIATTRWLGRELRCLTFLGQASEIDRPTILGTQGRPATESAIADYIFERAAEWDCLVMHEQRPESSFVSAMTIRLRQSGLVVTHADGPQCARVDVQGTWSQYLAARSRAFRKSLKRKETALESLGRIELDVADRDAGEGAISRYLAVERASWKVGAGLGVAKSSAHLAFYRAITGSAGDFEPRFRFLRIGDRTVAASFGVLWRRRFYSLHIAHDEAYSDYSPGVLLTARELQHAFQAKDCDVFDFLGGFLTNKRGWATALDCTLTLYADHPTWRGRLFHWLYFDLKPRLKRACARAGLLDPLLRAKKVLARRIRGLDTWT